MGYLTPVTGGGQVWAGLAGDPFFAEAAAFNKFVENFSKNILDASVFNQDKNLFARLNVSGVVLEVPNIALGGATIGVWCTATMVSHGVSAQITRWGIPLLTHLFLSNPQDKDAFNSGNPSDDRDHFTSSITSTVAPLPMVLWVSL
jgi:hypothetical protein